tara:strand:- start:37339 stop:38025 length:687 start_codon:yes stop_codon:yes gene_type:complete
MKVEVLSLGGSVIIPKSTDNIDVKFLKEFKKILLSFKDRNFVVVAGGGSTARKYMQALGSIGVEKKSKCLIGIALTRLHARLLTYFFGKCAAPQNPTNLKDIRKLVKKYKVVFTGALRYEEDNTSDGTAAKIANYFRTSFVNVTDVKGLFNKDPKKYKDAKLIRTISFQEFNKIMSKMQYSPGQHFILDQHAAKIIKKHKVKTVILDKNLRNLKNCLQGKKFLGTIIQ